jgi:hypothetical protein
MRVRLTRRHFHTEGLTMPTLVDYTVIKDQPFELATSGSTPHMFEFELPSSYAVTVSPVLQFVVRGNLSDDYIFQVGFNDPQELQSKSSLHYEFKNVEKSRIYSLHEVVQGSVLKPGTNTIYFRVSSGKVGFSDVVLWYQRTV